MPPLPSPAARGSRLLKNIALFCALSDFALQLGGGIAGQRLVLKVGLVLFLAAFPLFFLGLYLGRR